MEEEAHAEAAVEQAGHEIKKKTYDCQSEWDLVYSTLNLLKLMVFRQI